MVSAEQAASLRRTRLREELRDAELQISALKEQEALRRDLEEARGVAMMTSGALPLVVHHRVDTDARLLAELQAMLHERDAARSRALELRGELRAVRRRGAEPAPAALAAPPEAAQGALAHAAAAAAVAALGSSAAALLQPLTTEVAELAARLQALAPAGAEAGRLSPTSGTFRGWGGELGTSTSPRSPGGSALGVPASTLRAAEALQLELVQRAARLREGELQLERQRDQLRSLAAQDASRAMSARNRHGQRGELSGKLAGFGAQERELGQKAAYLGRESAALAERYEELKRVLFACMASLLRGPADAQEPVHPEEEMPSASVAAPDGRRGGVAALIHLLARKYGWPEVAFLRIDIRRLGRLSAEDLALGLLLGAGVDYPRVTGLTVHALFAAMDRRGCGSVSVSDFAECCPGLWQAHGSPPPTPEEKLRALPWAAVGGASEVFDEVADARVNGVPAGLSWPAFEEVVCRRLRGLPDAEARGLFTRLAVGGRGARGGGAIPLDVWHQATMDLPEEDG